MFDDANSKYKGKVTAYDSPIYIADAALYLMKTQPDLGIKDPYALNQEQFDAAIALLEEQRENIGEYWSDYLKEIQAFKTGSSTVGTTWQVIANLAEADVPVEGDPARGGRDRLVGHLDGLVEGEAPELHAYKWMDCITSPEANAAGGRVLRRGAGASQGV